MTAALVATFLVGAVVVPPAAADAPGASAASAVTAAAKSKRKTVAGTRCTVFPDNNYWNADVSKLPVHKSSTRWRKAIGTRNLHPDFGSAGPGEQPYGIPITVVSKSAKKSKVRFYYPDESDRVKYPLSSKTKIEGGGDRHAIIVNKSTCRLYELFDLSRSGSRWYAGSGATWSLKSNKLRKNGWTSADAAGLPILPGLLRWNEVKAGKVEHAIRFTAPVTANKHIWPAKHHAGSRSVKTHPPMGARFRLKKNFSTKGYSKEAKVVIKAMKKYGIVLADNGSGWYFQGEASTKWPSRLISDLKRIPSSAFVAVDTSKLKVRSSSARVR
ncbi:MAG: hypothetical protein GX593_11580 [Actinomycetales bacterium]|nr:hypothetical protein [Actinomycetales bacterium]